MLKIFLHLSFYCMPTICQALHLGILSLILSNWIWSHMTDEEIEDKRIWITFLRFTKGPGRRTRVQAWSLCVLFAMPSLVFSIIPILMDNLWHLIHLSMIVKLTWPTVTLVHKLWFSNYYLGACSNEDLETPVSENPVLAWGPGVCVLARCPEPTVLKVWLQQAAVVTPGNLLDMHILRLHAGLPDRNRRQVLQPGF